MNIECLGIVKPDGAIVRLNDQHRTLLVFDVDNEDRAKAILDRMNYGPLKATDAPNYRLVPLDPRISSPVREDLPPQVTCRYCGYSEYVIDMNRAISRVTDHEQQCDRKGTVAADPVAVQPGT